MRCKFREVNFWATQILSGHGSFRAYTKRLGKTEYDSKCMRFEEIRRQVVSELGRELSFNDLTETTTRSKRNWRLCGDLTRKIMEIKARDERRIERGMDETE
jgi:hypothetical protein